MRGGLLTTNSFFLRKSVLRLFSFSGIVFGGKLAGNVE